MVRLSLPVEKSDHVMGPDAAGVTLVEYGSYDCHHCLQASGVLADVREQFGAPIRLVYRHFPRETKHSVSERAAEAAEAAADQGKFWEMHACLLEHQDALDDANLIAYATLVGLDTKKFAAALETGLLSERVLRQFQSGLDSGVHSTPTFFINGVRHDDYWDADTLVAAIRAAVASP
jgi:protein-disulfide isomerase